MTDLSKIAFNEMTHDEHIEFEARWITQRANDLVVECGELKDGAADRAALDFERYLDQEGYTGRDERIYACRTLNLAQERHDAAEDADMRALAALESQ